MQVILRESMDNLGEAGTVVKVKAGYARNYLLPKGLAYEATDANLRRIEREKQRAEQRATDALRDARQRAAAMEGVSLTFHARAGEEGRLFGSITSGDLAEQLAVQGIEVDRRQIELDEPLKNLGVFSVPVRLHPEVRPEIKVWIIKES